MACGSWGRNAVLPSFIQMKEGDGEWLVSGARQKYAEISTKLV